MTIPTYTRTCTCPTTPRHPGEHTASCNDAHREGFVEFVQAYQRSFYARRYHNEDLT